MTTTKEGQTRTLKQVRRRRECEMCGAPATHEITYLYENARCNPASKGYGKDDISWCKDDSVFVCDEHKDKARWNPPSGMSWCADFPFSPRFEHLFFYWDTVEAVDGEDAGDE